MMPPRKFPSADFARNLRETFQQAKSTRQFAVAEEWPERMQEVGRVLATSYASDKFGAKELVEWKHLAESPCCLHAVPGFFRGKMVCGPTRMLSDMPRHVTELAPLLCIDVKLYADCDRDGRGVLGRGVDEGVTNIVVRDGVLFSGRTPRGDTFLFVATPQDGVLLMITGDSLRITRDGIVG